MSDHIPHDLGLVRKKDATGKTVWYVFIRCEGLKACRYGPFPRRTDALRFYRTALQGIDDFMEVDIPFDIDAGLSRQHRKVGKVCIMVGLIGERGSD